MGRLLAWLAAVVAGALLYVGLATWWAGRGDRAERTRPDVEAAPEAEPSLVSEAPTAGPPELGTYPPAQPVASPPLWVPPPDPLRRQATELLDPLIRPIGREADLLDLKFRYYLETCRRDFSGAPRAGASRFWFVVWEFRAQIEWGDDKVEPSSVGQPDAPDCRGTWIELYERTRSIADALERFEDTARANDVPPRYVDDLLATHRLTGWRQSSLRRRR